MPAMHVAELVAKQPRLRAPGPKHSWRISVRKDQHNATGFVCDHSIHEFLIAAPALHDDQYWSIHVKYHQQVRMPVIKAFFGEDAISVESIRNSSRTFKYDKIPQDSIIMGAVANVYRKAMLDMFETSLDDYIKQHNLSQDLLLRKCIAM